MKKHLHSQLQHRIKYNWGSYEFLHRVLFEQRATVCFQYKYVTECFSNSLALQGYDSKTSIALCQHSHTARNAAIKSRNGLQQNGGPLYLQELVLLKFTKCAHRPVPRHRCLKGFSHNVVIKANVLKTVETSML